MEENKKGTKDRSIFYKGNYLNFIVSIIFTVLFAGANIAVSFVLKDLMDVAYNKDIPGSISSELSCSKMDWNIKYELGDLVTRCFFTICRVLTY